MNASLERIYWATVAVVLVAAPVASLLWAGSTYGFAEGIEIPSAVYHLVMGPFPNFLLIGVWVAAPHALFEGRGELLTAISLAIHAAVVVATALWFYRSRALRLRTRALVLAAALVVGAVGYAIAFEAMMRLATEGFMNIIFGGGPPRP